MCHCIPLTGCRCHKTVGFFSNWLPRMSERTVTAQRLISKSLSMNSDQSLWLSGVTSCLGVTRHLFTSETILSQEPLGSGEGQMHRQPLFFVSSVFATPIFVSSLFAYFYICPCVVHQCNTGLLQNPITEWNILVASQDTHCFRIGAGCLKSQISNLLYPFFTIGNTN